MAIELLRLKSQFDYSKLEWKPPECGGFPRMANHGH
jgi:hypothetical protein